MRAGRPRSQVGRITPPLRGSRRSRAGRRRLMRWGRTPARVFQKSNSTKGKRVIHEGRQGIRKGVKRRIHKVTRRTTKGHQGLRRCFSQSPRLERQQCCHERMPTWERGRPARTRPGTASLISSHQSTGNGVAKELSTKLHEERPRATKGFGAATPDHCAFAGQQCCHERMPTWERGRPARTRPGTASLISSHQSTGNGVAKELSTKLHEGRPRATKGFGAATPDHCAFAGQQ